MAENEEQEQQTDHGVDLDAKIGGAVKSHLKRAQREMLAELSKLLGEQVTKAIESIKPPPAPPESDSDKGGDKNKSLPELKLLQEELEKLKKVASDERTARMAAEEKARKDQTRGQLREALDAKGIKGAKASALLALFESSGMLRFAEDGTPSLAVSRSRSKGAPAEELEFDLAAGIEDWSKTADAAEFIPAPTSGIAPGGRGKPMSNMQRKQAPRYEAPPESDEEAARRATEQLAAQGIDIMSVLND